jgi:hypothetical protein
LRNRAYAADHGAAALQEQPVSLIGFHRVLIASAIVFCTAFAAWQLLAFRRDGALLDAVVAIGFAAAAGLLTVYLVHLRRFLHGHREVGSDAAGSPEPR